MQKKPTHVTQSIRSSKQNLKSNHKRPPSHHPTSHPQPMIPANKKRTNSSYIQSSAKKKLQQAGYSHKKHNSNSSFKNNKHKIFQVEHIIPVGVRSTKNNKRNCLKVYSAITATNNEESGSINKKKIRKNFRNNESLGEIGYCRKVITEKSKAMSSCEGKPRARGLKIDDSPTRKQDNIKTDLDENILVKDNIRERKDCNNEENNTVKEKTHSELNKEKQNIENYSPNYQNQHQDLSKLNNINIQQLKSLNQMTSNQISQLQSRSQTIDLLKFTIKTKLQKDHLTQSPHKLNSLTTSSQKPIHSQYIQQILQLKQLQTNFYVEKITTLQNELNRFRKESERQEKDGKAKWEQERRKVLAERDRVVQENGLLKRENQALRAIIMKKLKGNDNRLNKKRQEINGSLQVEVSTINDYDY